MADNNDSTWKEKNLGSLFKIKHGYAFKGEFFSDRGDFIVLTPGNFFDEGGFRHKENKEKYYSGLIPPEYILKKGDLIIVMTEQAEGLLGSAAFIPKNNCYLHNQRLGLITECNPHQMDRRFLYYLFNSNDIRQKIRASASGTKVRHTSPTRIYEIKQKVPSVSTQRKIAAILSAYDDLIENNTRRIKILEEMAQAIYREWFVHFRFPGHEGVRMVESKLGLIPEGWEITPLSSLVDTQYGFTESANEKKVGPKFLRGMDINKQTWIDWDSVPYCIINDADFIKFELKVGDIVIIRMADPGKVGIIEREIKSVFASYLIRITLKSDKINPYYLYYFLLSERYQGYITGAVTGTTRKSASAGVIIGIDLILPPQKILIQFNHQIYSIRKLLNYLLNINTNLRRTRDLLLPRLISGELDVSELDIVIPEENT